MMGSNSKDKYFKQRDLDVHPFTTTAPGWRLFFCWLLPLLKYGYRNTLEIEDVYPVVKEDAVHVLVGQLERNWNRELETSRERGREPSLLKVIMKTIMGPFLLTGIPLFLLSCVFAIAGALLVASFVQFFYDDPSTTGNVHVIATLIAVNRIAIGFLIQPTYFWNNRIGMRARTAVSGLVFKKILRLSQASLSESSTGQIINILATDVQIFEYALTLLHHIWIIPIMTVICFVILWQFLGPFALVPLLIAISLVPVSLCLGKLSSKLRLQRCLLTDTRVGIMNEVITAIQLIKVHGWEKPFSELLQKARGFELSKIQEICNIRAIEISLPLINASVSIFVTCVAFAASGHVLTTSMVFVVLPIANIVMKEVSLHFLGACTRGGELVVVIHRIQRFLMLEENSLSSVKSDKSANNQTKSSMTDHTTTSDPMGGENVPLLAGPTSKSKVKIDHSYPGIDVRDLSGKWSQGEDKPIFSLSGFTFTVSPGEVVAVIGPVGSGKSMLLMALLGELPLSSGSVSVSSKTAFSDQQPWVFSNTIRENILFGKDYDSGRFKAVLTQCDLNQDLANLPNGDLTLVGEKGVKLSGGQRSRVSLARTLYQNADVYLLDDPLSAVDTTVGRHLFEECILGALKDKAVLLVTHQLQYLKAVDRIIIIKEGKMSGYGTYQELLAAGVDFGALDVSGKDENEDDVTSDDTDTVLDGNTKDQRPPAKDKNVLQEEEGKFEKKEEGSVGSAVYTEYILAGAGLVFLAFFLTIDVSAASFRILSDWWLASWTGKEQLCLQEYNQTTCLSDPNRSHFFRVYGIFIAVMVLSVIASARLLLYILVSASRNLHNQMFEAVLRSPLQFFVVNPVGRVLNRFTKDLGIMEDRLTFLFSFVNHFILHVMAVFIFIAITNPFILVFMVPMVIVCWVIRRVYMESARDVKRLESLANSPVYSHLSLTLAGLTTVRAFSGQEFMYRQYCRHQDLQTTTFFLHLSLERWLSLNMELLQISLCIVLVYGSILINNYFPVDGAKLGISLAYLMVLSGEFPYGVRLTGELENLMVATERVIEYTKLPPEAALKTGITPEKGWPHNGEIILKDTSLIYPGGKDYALKNLNATIKPQEKIGIVGRTGAGKSSLTVALLRLAEPSGKIYIDGLDISSIGLHDLRKNISFIPQDPLLFEGTIRKNLDPFGLHNDEELWSSIKEVQLEKKIQQEAHKLDMVVTEGGGNFSVGEKQLVCLARALLSKNRILVIDEATANVDYETDQLIQATIREKFSNCTILTIAHRLSSIMDSDRVMVLEAGKIVEFDKPSVLLQNADGFFAKLESEARHIHTRGTETFIRLRTVIEALK